METPNGADSSPASSEFSLDHDHTDLESLNRSPNSFLSKSVALEETLTLLRGERDEAVREKKCLSERIDELEACVRDKEDDFVLRMEGLRLEAEIYRERIGEMEIERDRRKESLAKSLDSVKESLIKILKEIEEENIAADSVKEIADKKESEVSEELVAVTRLVLEAEEKVKTYKELRKKEKKELEESVVSLTEENRDINTLLRVALLEKEAVEKRLKGSTEHRGRVAILQRVGFGFGFMMGSGTGVDQSSEASGSKSDSSECEEEVVSLASTVERIMKNLRLEITQLRRSLDESRSDCERLQSLSEKQAQDIAENAIYITELEDRERDLAQNVEELFMAVRETEEEVARWREACELEVEAAKVEIQERDKVVVILKQELDKTKASLDLSNGKLNLKQELAAAAMAAQATAEKSLELADSRAVGLRARIEDLSKQLEALESRERSSRKLRHLCWPWRALKPTTANKMLPEMQALLY